MLRSGGDFFYGYCIGCYFLFVNFGDERSWAFFEKGCTNKPTHLKTELQILSCSERNCKFRSAGVIPYKAILKINSDSSFNYEFGECGTHGISNGKWYIKNNYIVLNNNNPDSTLYIVPYMRIKPGIYLLNVKSKDNSITKKSFIV